MVCDRMIKTHHWDPHPDGFTDGGSRLLDLLEQLSAHYHTVHFFFPHAIEPTQFKSLLKVLNQRHPDLRLGLSCTIDRQIASDFAAGDVNGAIVQIHWRVMGQLPDLGFFKAFSRAGVWNHLMLDGAAASPENCKAVARQPNIVHSWETTRTDDGGCDSNSTYGQVRSLPGRPLWRRLNDPVEQFLLVGLVDQGPLAQNAHRRRWRAPLFGRRRPRIPFPRSGPASGRLSG